MGYSAPDMLPSKNHSGKLFILRNTFVDCHFHLPKHQSDQASGARSSHKPEDMMRMQLVDSYVLGCGSLLDLDHQRLVDLDHQRLENE